MDLLWICLVLVLLTISAGEEGWSMNVQSEVRGIQGYPVVLPCTFSHPQHSQHSSLQVLWRLGHGAGATILFHCTSLLGTRTCDPGPQQDQRYRLEGNPREHDLSLRINSAALQDSGRYFCRVEVQGHEQISFEDKMGTRLRVEAPPQILVLSVEGSKPSGYRALCSVQGSPLPDVQWLGPDELLEGSSQGPMAQGSPARHHTVSQLRDVEPGQQYTCSASNPLGRDRATLYVLQPRAGPSGAPTALLLVLLVALGGKAILVLGTGLWAVQGGVCCWKR